MKLHGVKKDGEEKESKPGPPAEHHGKLVINPGRTKETGKKEKGQAASQAGN